MNRLKALLREFLAGLAVGTVLASALIGIGHIIGDARHHTPAAKPNADCSNYTLKQYRDGNVPIRCYADIAPGQNQQTALPTRKI